MQIPQDSYTRAFLITNLLMTCKIHVIQIYEKHTLF